MGVYVCALALLTRLLPLFPIVETFQRINFCKLFQAERFALVTHKAQKISGKYFKIIRRHGRLRSRVAAKNAIIN